MQIRFSRHALEKFQVLSRHGVRISRNKVVETVEFPDKRDYSRLPLFVAQGNLNKSHVLRVVYRKDADSIFIITFYPGRKSQYEK